MSLNSYLKVSERLQPLQLPHKIYKADSGAIKFEMKARSNNRWPICPLIYLITKECPHKTIYKIKIYYSTGLIYLDKDEKQIKIKIPTYLAHHIPRQCWLSWYNDTLQIGVVESSKCLKPFFVYEDKSFSERNPKKLIGFIKFSVNQYIDWNVQTSPVVLNPISVGNIKDGQLRWVKKLGEKLPSDALIGGFENEPLYIARARHGSSICPGKYIHSKNKAYVPWGHVEHEKEDFEILCGYNAVWVKCKNNFVPENVFIAGLSEVHGEHVYIGRAMIKNSLIIGKVHMLYKKCYLPYKGMEVEKYTYEILVRGDTVTYGMTCNHNCMMNPVKANQPCI